MAKLTNQMVANMIDSMNLSDKARYMVENTEIRIFAEMFGGCSEEDIEYLSEEMYNGMSIEDIASLPFNSGKEVQILTAAGNEELPLTDSNMEIEIEDGHEQVVDSGDGVIQFYI